MEWGVEGPEREGGEEGSKQGRGSRRSSMLDGEVMVMQQTGPGWTVWWRCAWEQVLLSGIRSFLGVLASDRPGWNNLANLMDVSTRMETRVAMRTFLICKAIQ